MARGKPISICVSAGELIDKITILQIKTGRVDNAEKRGHVRQELKMLRAVRARAIPPSRQLAALGRRLRSVNERLWHIEDAIRRCERRQDFGPRFVELARSVYCDNDERSELKRRINDLVGSSVVEEKCYARYK
jgi:hypothetical protein